ncbi:MAG: hypothetical protein DPW16_01715 [Chloroflexi bacterium]|nr:hypothetical protein [Chloroflexota bacterium]
MRKWIYNLEFPDWCPVLTIFGYKFIRVEDYQNRLNQLQHLVTVHSEFEVLANTGQHAITAYVEIPKSEDKAVLEWANQNCTALNDILLLLSLFIGRDVFAIDENNVDIGVITADPREYQWGGTLRCSIPYKKQVLDSISPIGYDIGFEEGLNQIYSIMRTNEWQKKYEGGYFLFLANQAFRRQSLESAFSQCWTIWEHLFTLHNRRWLSRNQIHQLEAVEKISFIMTEYALKGEIDEVSRNRIKSLVTVRNKLIHFGRFENDPSTHDHAILFVHLTEFVMAKIMGLWPSDVFNTTDRLEDFLKQQVKTKK